MQHNATRCQMLHCNTYTLKIIANSQHRKVGWASSVANLLEICFSSLSSFCRSWTCKQTKDTGKIISCNSVLAMSSQFLMFIYCVRLLDNSNPSCNSIYSNKKSTENSSATGLCLYLFLGPFKTFLRVVNVGHQQRSTAHGMALGRMTLWSLNFFWKHLAEQAATIMNRFFKRHIEDLCPSHSKLLLLFLKLIFFTCSGLQVCSLLWFQDVCTCSVYFLLFPFISV